MLVIGRPDDSEVTPWGRGDVSLVEGADIARILSGQTQDYLALVRSLDGAHTYASGKWTVGQIVGHVTDTERIFAYRLLCIGRGDRTPFPGFEQDDYMACAAFHERPLRDLIDEFEAVRQGTLCLVSGLPANAWLRRGTVDGYSVTTRGIAFQLAGHERHHASILREKYLYNGPVD